MRTIKCALSPVLPAIHMIIIATWCLFYQMILNYYCYWWNLIGFTRCYFLWPWGFKLWALIEVFKIITIPCFACQYFKLKCSLCQSTSTYWVLRKLINRFLPETWKKNADLKFIFPSFWFRATAKGRTERLLQQLQNQQQMVNVRQQPPHHKRQQQHQLQRFQGRKRQKKILPTTMMKMTMGKFWRSRPVDVGSSEENRLARSLGSFSNFLLKPSKK